MTVPHPGPGRRRLVAAVALLLAALLASGCGASGTTSAASEPAPGAEVSAVPTTAAVPATETAVSAACAEPAAFASTDAGGRATEPIGLLDSRRRAWCLGPALLHDQVLADARVSPGQGGGSAVTLTVAPGTEALWNQALGYCFRHDPAICASGRLAVLLDGVVLTIPTIATDRIDGDELQLGGRFADEKPATLEARLRAGRFSLRPVLMDLGAAAQGG